MADKNLKVKIFLQQLNERLGMAGSVLIILVACGMGIFIMSTMPKTGGLGDVGEVLYKLSLIVLMGIAGGYVIFRTFVSKAVDRFTGSLFYTRRFIDKVPPILSVVRGKIAVGEVAEAEEMLKELIRVVPTNAEVVWLLSQLYMNELHSPVKALGVLCDYFNQDKREDDDEISKMLFFLADICAENNFHGAVKPILERELKRKNYSDTEKKYIEARLNNLKDRTIQ